MAKRGDVYFYKDQIFVRGKTAAIVHRAALKVGMSDKAMLKIILRDVIDKARTTCSKF